jgi:hypothetical protein
MFLYLPFEHSESREDQALAVALIGQLGNEEWTRYAEEHKALIERFDRFPHRNRILNRASSAAELAVLQNPTDCRAPRRTESPALPWAGVLMHAAVIVLRASRSSRLSRHDRAALSMP